jgi:hypothetical protein
VAPITESPAQSWLSKHERMATHGSEHQPLNYRAWA